MSIIKTFAAGVAASGLLLSTAAYASDTHADASVGAPVAHPLTKAKTVKLKRKAAATDTYSSDAAHLLPALLVVGGAATAVTAVAVSSSSKG